MTHFAASLFDSTKIIQPKNFSNRYLQRKNVPNHDICIHATKRPRNNTSNSSVRDPQNQTYLIGKKWLSMSGNYSENYGSNNIRRNSVWHK